jgi:hypothetical protein
MLMVMEVVHPVHWTVRAFVDPADLRRMIKLVLTNPMLIHGLKFLFSRGRRTQSREPWRQQRSHPRQRCFKPAERRVGSCSAPPKADRAYSSAPAKGGAGPYHPDGRGVQNIDETRLEIDGS